MLLSRMKEAALLAAALCCGLATGPSSANSEWRGSDRIQPYAENPRYWQYGGQPVILLGGSKDDNLFQAADLENHLRLLASIGGNYIRNTMSSRDEGNVQPFARRPDGRYDLERSNDEYWLRFEKLLRLTQELGIIVQIEVWDRFDFSRDHWETQAFNPKNNVNYSYEQSRFEPTYPDHPAKNMQPFFFTTPRQQNNSVVLRYQQRFVDEMLRRSLSYPNVLYCIDNETSGEEAWSAYWVDYIRARGREAGVRVFVTQMWDDWNLKAPRHGHTLANPERYDFLEVSQNNHQRSESHWNHFHWARQHLGPRPMNAVKTYGADIGIRLATTPGATRARLKSALRTQTTNAPGDYGTAKEGIARWWRNLLGGAAAVRFHRPEGGIGLTDPAQKQIRSARLLLEEFDIFRAVPDAQHELLGNRTENEAYATRIDGEAYAVYFPDRGDVRMAVAPGVRYTLRWLDVSDSRWSSASIVDDASQPVRLKTPASGQWVALIKRTAVSLPVTDGVPRSATEAR